MTNRSLFLKSIVFSICLINFACGGKAYQSKGTSEDQNITVPTSSGTQQYGAPPISTRVGAIGYRSTSIDVRVNKILKIKFTPGINDEQIEGTGYSPQYSKLAVFIKVGDESVATPLLNNGLQEDQQSSAVIDFSDKIEGQCGDDPICRETITITIEKPNNDYWCLNWETHCSHTHVHDTHPWNGTIMVQTDDTRAL